MRLVLLTLLFTATATLVAADNMGPPASPALIEVAKSLEKSIASGELATANRIWDVDRYAERILTGMKLNEKDRKGFCAGLASKFKWGDIMSTQLGDGGTYRLLRTYKKNGRPHALFRMLNGQGMVNYHDLEFSKDGAGAKAFDAYIYMTGEMLSETTRTAVAPALAQSMGWSLSKLLGLQEDNGLDSLNAMKEQIDNGDHAGALKTFKSLSETAQKTKYALIMRLRAAQQLGDTEHQAAITALVTTFPHDAAVDFIQIDGYTLSKEFDKSLACIDRLDQALGGDSYLDALRGATLLVADRLPEARLKAEAAAKAQPDLVPVWWSLVTIVLKQKDHARTAELLSEMEERFSLSFGDLTKVDAYKDFAATPEHAAWLAKHAAPAEP